MNNKLRLDAYLQQKGMVVSRSQAENLIRLGKVELDGKIIKKAGHMVSPGKKITIIDKQYVSRAAYKLASVAELLHLNFADKTVLDVGSSTGGFTDYALQKGAARVIAVDVGTEQMNPSLRNDERIILLEQTDIRDLAAVPAKPDIVVIDVSFISLQDVLPHIAKLISKDCLIVAMLKPQFEAGAKAKHKGVIKNARVRRDIISDFENWLKDKFIILDKADSAVEGTKGNLERFYALKNL